MSPKFPWHTLTVLSEDTRLLNYAALAVLSEDTRPLNYAALADRIIEVALL